MDRAQESEPIDRLKEELRTASGATTLFFAGIGMSGEREDGPAEPFGADLLRRAIAVENRHTDIHDDDIEVRRPLQEDGFLAIAREFDGGAGTDEDSIKQILIIR